jgi:hypothetical protein
MDEQEVVVDIVVPELLERRGRFTVDACWLVTKGDTVFTIMDHVIVTRCEHMYVENRFAYTALSHQFRRVHPSEETPWYDIVVHKGKDTVLVDFVERED